MTTAKLTGNDTTTTTTKKREAKNRFWRRRCWIFLLTGLAVILAAIVIWKVNTTPPAPAEPPEAAKVLAAQENLKNFGILIPAYLPKGFDRAAVDIKINQNGQGGQPAVAMVYRTTKGASIFINQWVPANPEMEILSGSRIIETRWGKSWLLSQGTEGLINVWVDVGPLRVSLATANRDVVSREQLVMAAETLGLASDLQSYSFVTEFPQIKDMAPPPPFKVAVNSQGVQEFNLTITPGGFTPIRFEVQKGIPVKITFRALGEVGCGNTITIPTEGGNYGVLEVTKTKLSDSLTFTPHEAGQFKFFCSSDHYRGIMFVREGSNP
jgi:hypothetical protein